MRAGWKTRRAKYARDPPLPQVKEVAAAVRMRFDLRAGGGGVKERREGVVKVAVDQIFD